MKRIRKQKVLKATYFAVLISFIIPLIFLVVMAILALGDAELSRDKSDYILMIGECILGILVINIPSILAKKLKFEFPVTLNIMYLIFLYCAIVLGEVHSFYYIVPHWDMILHCFSSMMLGTFGFMFVSLINKDPNTTMRLSPAFVAIFAFGFAISIGVFWEFYEYIADTFWGTNMQKYRLQDGTILSGNKALSDTMEDLIIDAVGAFIISVSGFFSLKNKKKEDHGKYFYLLVDHSPSMREILEEAEREKEAVAEAKEAAKEIKRKKNKTKNKSRRR